jgi:hypothetical protein
MKLLRRVGCAVVDNEAILVLCFSLFTYLPHYAAEHFSAQYPPTTEQLPPKGSASTQKTMVY